MADWSNYPTGGATPPAQNTDTNSKEWQAHIKDMLEDLNPGKVLKQKAVVSISGPVDIIVGGSEDSTADDPTKWELSGNEKVGKFDWNCWTRRYKTLKVQRYMVVTIRYWVSETVSGAKEIATETFYIAQGGEKTYNGAMVYVWKLASFKKEGIYLNVKPAFEITIKDIKLGSVELEGLKLELTSDKEKKVDTPPPPDAKLPKDAKHGDPAKEIEDLKMKSVRAVPFDLSLAANDGFAGSISLKSLFGTPGTPDDELPVVEFDGITTGGHYGQMADEATEGAPAHGASGEIAAGAGAEKSDEGCLWEGKTYSVGAVVKMGDGKCHTCEKASGGFGWSVGRDCGQS